MNNEVEGMWKEAVVTWFKLISCTVIVIQQLMKQQAVVTHIIRQTEIPALLDSWV